MKTKRHLIILVCILSVLTTYGQTNSNLNELLTRLDQNHMGAITDVFTTSEIETLRAHFDSETPYIEAVSNNTVFAPENVNGDFGSFQTTNPEFYNVIGQSGTADFEGAGAYDPSSGLFYVIDNVGNAYTVNPDTGQYIAAEMVMAPAGESFTGLEFDPVDGTLYAISTNGMGTSSLSIIDPETGEVDTIGDTGMVLAIALAIDLLGSYLYAFDIDTDATYRIDKTNAQAVLLGALGFDASFGQGMFLNPATGAIYLTAFNNGTFQSELRMLNTDTGATTFAGPIGSSTPGGTLQFAWGGFNKLVLGTGENTIPELTIFPNPGNDLLTISATENIQEVILVNLLGQELLRIQPNQRNTSIDVKALTAGTYIVSISSGGNKISRQFIKQ